MRSVEGIRIVIVVVRFGCVISFSVNGLFDLGMMGDRGGSLLLLFYEIFEDCELKLFKLSVLYDVLLLRFKYVSCFSFFSVFVSFFVLFLFFSLFFFLFS